MDMFLQVWLPLLLVPIIIISFTLMVVSNKHSH